MNSSQMFPSVTICPYPNDNSVLNSTILTKCGLDKDQYFNDNKWTGQGSENCSDPKLLFYDMIWKPEDLVKVNFFQKQCFKKKTTVSTQIECNS